MDIFDLQGAQGDPFGLQPGPAPALFPVFAGECRLDLSGVGVVTVTSAYCTNWPLAIDGDPATFASFAAAAGQPGSPPLAALVVTGASVPAANGTYVDNGTLVGGKTVFQRQGSDAGYVIHASTNGFDTVNGAYVLLIESDSIYWGGGAGGPATANGVWNNGGNAGSGSPPTVAATTVQVTPPTPGPATTPTARFLKIDWGTSLGDRFLTRIRLLVGGDGAAIENGAIAFLSALGEIEHGGEVDVLLPELPLFVTDGPIEGGVATEIYEIVLDVPPLARGLIFYPDYLLPLDGEGSAPLVNLYELQPYEACSRSVPTMPTTKKRARVGVSQVKIYPWNDVTGPYDDTVASQLLGLSSLGITKTVKTAKVTGGETTHQLGSYETERETKIKVTAAITDVNAIHIILGGAYVVDPANANGGEVQYFSENIDDRAPYFRLLAQSSNGDGKDSFVYPKMKVDGSVTFNLEKDKVTELEFEAICYWDSTYVRQDAQIGGIYEQLFGSKGDTAMHS